jgi:ankyrin repeat protein
LACENGLVRLVEALLESGADPNVQTAKSSNLQTPMHKAILNNHESILELFIMHNRTARSSSKPTTTTKITANFNIRDADGQTVLSLSLWNSSLSLAKKLIGNYIITTTTTTVTFLYRP